MRKPLRSLDIFFLAALAILVFLLAGCSQPALEEKAAVPGTVKILPTDTVSELVSKAARVVPSERQLAWQALEFKAFVHFGMNTFTDRE